MPDNPHLVPDVGVSGPTVRFDPDLDIWVVEHGEAGPAGITAWEAAGVRWMADLVEPGRMVRCDIEAAALDGPNRHRTLDLVELLLGRPQRELVDAGRPTSGDSGQPRPVPVGAGSPAPHHAGWLAIALDELTATPEGPSLVAADALLLARRLGIDDLLPEIDIDEVADLVDSLDGGFLDRMQAEDDPVFDHLLRAYGAVLHAAGMPVDRRIVPRHPAPPASDNVDALARELLERAGISRSTAGNVQPDFTGPAPPTHVWCQGLLPGAVTGASVALRHGGRAASVEATVGDHPPEELHVQALRTGGGQFNLVNHVRLHAGPEPSTLVAELRWLGTGADTLRLVTRPDEGPPAQLRPSDEALHWAREAARLARRPDQAMPGTRDTTVRRATAVGHMWSLSARFWRAAGAEDLAQAAEQRIAEGVPPSPFLQDQPAAANLVAPSSGEHRATPSLADTADLLGLPAVTAAARLAAARQLLADGQADMAAAAAALARRAYRLIGDHEGMQQAAAVGTEADVASTSARASGTAGDGEV